MSDETSGGFYGNGVDAGQPSQPTTEQPKYVTAEALQELEQRILKSVQSLTDKQESRVNKQLAEWEKRASEQGITVTPAMKTAAQERIALSMLDGMDGAAQHVLPDTELAVRVAKVNKQLAEIDAEFGSALSPDDDEWTEVNFNANPKDPDGVKFLRAYRKQQQAKAQRLAAEGGPPQPNATDPQARMRAPSGAPTGNRMEQITVELNQLMKRPSENPKRIHELNKELGNLLRG